MIIVTIYHTNDAIESDADQYEREREKEDKRDLPVVDISTEILCLMPVIAYRFVFMADLSTMGIGKPTIKRSVTTSLVPIVIS